MKPEAQRIAIAEACPEIAYVSRDESRPWLGVHCFWKGRSHNVEFDPLNDLNAMHEAEKVLTLKQLRRMTVEIHDIMTRDPKQDWIPVHHCTAGQRAEAFLRTLGKWETDASHLSTVESDTAQHLT